MPNGTYGGVRGGLVSTYSILVGKTCFMEGTLFWLAFCFRGGNNIGYAFCFGKKQGLKLYFEI